MCYKQKCKVVSLNLAHPVYMSRSNNRNVTYATIEEFNMDSKADYSA